MDAPLPVEVVENNHAEIENAVEQLFLFSYWYLRSKKFECLVNNQVKSTIFLN